GCKNFDVRKQAVRRDSLQRRSQTLRQFVDREQRSRGEAKDCSKQPCHFRHIPRRCSDVCVKRRGGVIDASIGNYLLPATDRRVIRLATKILNFSVVK